MYTKARRVSDVGAKRHKFRAGSQALLCDGNGQTCLPSLVIPVRSFVRGMENNFSRLGQCLTTASWWSLVGVTSLSGTCRLTLSEGWTRERWTPSWTISQALDIGHAWKLRGQEYDAITPTLLAHRLYATPSCNKFPRLGKMF